MKVYVITKGEYSDYHICAVAVDRDKADLLVKKFSDKYETAEIEEYDTNKSDTILSYKNLYRCWYRISGKISINETGVDFLERKDFKVRKNCMGELYVTVNAEDKDKALKIASDKFAKYRAEQLGL